MTLHVYFHPDDENLLGEHRIVETHADVEFHSDLLVPRGKFYILPIPLEPLEGEWTWDSEASINHTKTTNELFDSWLNSVELTRAISSSSESNLVLNHLNMSVNFSSPDDESPESKGQH